MKRRQRQHRPHRTCPYRQLQGVRCPNTMRTRISCRLKVTFAGIAMPRPFVMSPPALTEPFFLQNPHPPNNRPPLHHDVLQSQVFLLTCPQIIKVVLPPLLRNPCLVCIPRRLLFSLLRAFLWKLKTIIHLNNFCWFLMNNTRRPGILAYLLLIMTLDQLSLCCLYGHSS
ncbi:hypothetical protein ARMSODRAFT_370954 [Armillaria solidipes]|uniref:Uncharacterized protein n=1 Tax=Armillaria solidipes TaxID=1076256 RepID=A0A2H3B5H2_9AGAR|nr:hypothetical protein ARMSODRAFT_370954 [Armillaria solidipes]